MKAEGRVCCFIIGADKKQVESNTSKAVLTEEIKRLIEKENIRHFLCGMTPAELPAAAAVLEIKAQYPKVTLDCVLPYEEQSAHWKDAVREVYFNILADCDSVITLQTHFESKCISEHRKYILGKAQYALYLEYGESVKSSVIEKRLAKLDIPYSRISVI